jgi:multidrug efflux pump subunit AcrB
VSARVWLRCVLVSLIAAVLVRPATMTAMAPAEGEQVVDWSAVDAEELARVPEAELSERLQSLPMRQISGFERFTYWFTHPQWYLGLRSAIAVWFAFFLAATVAVSFLNSRDKRRA